MELKRNINNILNEWYTSNKSDWFSKPLIIEGARQIGKTTTILNFLKSKKNKFAHIDMSVNTNIYQVIKSLDIDLLIDYIKKNYDYDQNKPCIFFDEAQKCLEIIQLLKYFRERYPEIKIIVTGSLLSFKLSDYRNIMFPTGKVNTIHMYPLTFEEFIINVYSDIQDNIVKIIKQCDFQKFNLIYKEELTKIYYEYLIIGGMPESVVNYIESINDKKIDNKFFGSTRNIKQIVTNYLSDIENHFDNPNERKKSLAIFNSIHKQINKENKRFVLNEIEMENRENKNNKFRDFKIAFWKLMLSRMVNYIYYLSEFKMPFNNFDDESRFKIYYSDVGFYTSIYDIDVDDIIFNKPKWTLIKGGVVENFVYNELKYNSDVTFIDSFNMFTYSKNNKEENIELDFIFDARQLQPFVVEVKSSKNTKSISFDKVRKTNYDINFIKASLKDFNNNGSYLEIPIYLIGYFHKYVINSYDKDMYDKYELKH